MDRIALWVVAEWLFGCLFDDGCLAVRQSCLRWIASHCGLLLSGCLGVSLTLVAWQCVKVV